MYSRIVLRFMEAEIANTEHLLETCIPNKCVDAYKESLHEMIKSANFYRRALEAQEGTEDDNT